MYLLTEVTEAPLPELSSDGAKAGFVQAYGTPAKPEEPERDAQHPIDKIFLDFHPDADFRSISYSVDRIGETINSSWDHMTDPTGDLRVIGGATSKGREFYLPKGYRGGKKPLLDTLAINLIRGLVHTGDVYDSSKRSREYIDFYAAFAELSDPDCWAELPTKVLFRGNFTFRLRKERTIFIEIDGAIERFIFVAKVIPDDPYGDGIGESYRIVELKQTGRGKPSGPEAKRIKDGIDRILRDCLDRTALSETYDHGPFTPGFPAPLRAKIKKTLSEVDIENGYYSREGFSSGVFPYRVTRAKMDDYYGVGALLFERCTYCGSVERLSIEQADAKKTEACRNLTKFDIRPWHESICRDSDGAQYYGDPIVHEDLSAPAPKELSSKAQYVEKLYTGEELYTEAFEKWSQM